jgi:hypothetical protein
MDVEKALVDAAIRTLSFTKADSRLGRLVGNELKMVGKTLAAQLGPDDEPILFVPLEVQAAGKWEKGGILGLRDRVLIAWWTGTLRPQTYIQAVAHAAIEKIETVKTEPATWRLPEKVWLAVKAEKPLLLRAMNIKDQANLPFLVNCALTGAISPAETSASTER